MASRLDAGTLDRAEKQDRTDSSRQQHNSGASVRHGVYTVTVIVAAVIIIVAAVIIISVIVAVSIRQGGEYQSGGY